MTDAKRHVCDPLQRVGQLVVVESHSASTSSRARFSSKVSAFISVTRDSYSRAAALSAWVGVSIL